jgi:hypothetical protein
MKLRDSQVQQHLSNIRIRLNNKNISQTRHPIPFRVLAESPGHDRAVQMAIMTMSNRDQATIHGVYRHRP